MRRPETKEEILRDVLELVPSAIDVASFYDEID